MNAHPLSPHNRNQELLGEMLHSLCQPLTSLHCSLELSVSDHSLQSVSAALEQTETVIRMVRLMREYLDSQTTETEKRFISLMPILESIGEDLGSIALVKGVHLQTTGSSDSTVQIEEPWLRLALQYMVEDLIDRQIAGNKIVLSVCDVVTETVIQAQSKGPFHPYRDVSQPRGLPSSAALSNENHRDSTGMIMRRCRLAIATQVLENAGAEAIFARDGSSFVVRFPRRDTPSV